MQSFGEFTITLWVYQAGARPAVARLLRNTSIEESQAKEIYESWKRDNQRLVAEATNSQAMRISALWREHARPL